ncbi:MAG: hypothetical protein ACYCTF_03005 [Acidiferrobacter sp.]
MNESDLFALPFPGLWVLAYEDEDPLALSVLERRVALMQAHDPAIPDHDRCGKRAHKEELMAMPLFSLVARSERDSLAASVFTRRIFSLKNLCFTEALNLGKTEAEAKILVRTVVGGSAEEIQEKAACGELERAVDRLHALAERSPARPAQKRTPKHAHKGAHPFRRRKRQKEKGDGDEALDQEINGNR